MKKLSITFVKKLRVRFTARDPGLYKSSAGRSGRPEKRQKAIDSATRAREASRRNKPDGREREGEAT